MSESKTRSLKQTLQLVERAQNDDDAALQALFARYLPRVRRIAALRLGRLPQELLDVDDVTQEAMADAFANLRKFDVDSDGKFCNWLAKLVENRIRMTLRAGRTEKRGGGRMHRFADAPHTIHDSHVRGGEPTPSQHAAGAELNERMEHALLKISERQRELIIQRYFCQMPYEEIAEAMDFAGAPQVRTAYSRALRELRTHLDPPGTTYAT